MKTITVRLPDSVELSKAQIQDLVLTKIAEQQNLAALPPAGSLAAPLNRAISVEEAADIRQLIGL